MIPFNLLSIEDKSNTDEKWTNIIAKIDQALSKRIRGCGTYGTVQVYFSTKGKASIYGGLCGSRMCPTCAQRLAKEDTQTLSDVIFYLTSVEAFKEEQFLFGALTMSKYPIPDPMSRATLLSDTIKSWIRQRWFKSVILGYEIGLDIAGSELADGLHIHFHPLLITKPNIDIEDFKQRTHLYFQSKMGTRNINWGSPGDERWDNWLQPAKLSPSLYKYFHGFAWKGSHEVAACSFKNDKILHSYSNLFNRHPEDLKEIVPIMRKLDSVRRGGLIPKVRKLITAQNEIRACIGGNGLEIPPAFWSQVPFRTRRRVAKVLGSPGITPEQSRWIIQTMIQMEPEDLHLAATWLEDQIAFAA